MEKKVDLSELSMKFMDVNTCFTDFHLDLMDISDDLSVVIGAKKVIEIHLAVIRLSSLISFAQNKILYEQIQSSDLA